MAVTWRRLAYYDEIAGSGGIVPTVIAASETITIATDEQLVISETYEIDGTGNLVLDGNSLFAVDD